MSDARNIERILSVMRTLNSALHTRRQAEMAPEQAQYLGQLSSVAEDHLAAWTVVARLGVFSADAINDRTIEAFTQAMQTVAPSAAIWARVLHQSFQLLRALPGVPTIPPPPPPPPKK